MAIKLKNHLIVVGQYKYKLKCVFCRKEVIRKVRLKRPVCDNCKYRYKKKGSEKKEIRNKLILQLKNKGFSNEHIGKMLGISRQRVWQIYKKYKKGRKDVSTRN